MQPLKVNLKMATESTTIARASHQDSRALRYIQILSMLFLPASLVSSIFGMGFFSTSTDRNGKAILVISHNWWLYLAISIPLTLVCLLSMGWYNAVFKSKGKTPFDTENIPLSEKKAE